MIGEIPEEVLIGGGLHAGGDADVIHDRMEKRRKRFADLAAEMALREINERPYMPCSGSCRGDGPGFAG